MKIKFLLLVTLTVFSSLGLATRTWAQVGQSASTPAPTAPTPDSTSDADQIESLTIQQDPERITDQEQSNRLDSQAAQINQRLSVGQRRGPQLRDLLNLPDGMIIRGSSRGGVGIGAEY